MLNRVLQMIGRTEVRVEDIAVTEGGAIIIEIGKPDISKMIKTALDL